LLTNVPRLGDSAPSLSAPSLSVGGLSAPGLAASGLPGQVEQRPDLPRHGMTLFVAGASRRSLRAVDNVREFCDQELTGGYDLAVVDLYRAPEQAHIAQVIAAPTLLRHTPEPVRRIIGDMSDRARLRAAIKVA
jgi:circadian clock protein KaiB